MNIKEFTDKFPDCPKCRSPLVQNAWCAAYNVGEFNIDKIVVAKDKLKLSVADPISNLKRLDFSINYDNGDVRVYNATRKSDLDKFHDLTLSFQSHCDSCGGFKDLLGFDVGFYGKYNPRDFVFNDFGLDFVSFTYAVDEIVYSFYSFYGTDISRNAFRKVMHSSLSIHRLNSGEVTGWEDLPLIDFNVFDFSDKEKMRHKLNNITILA